MEKAEEFLAGWTENYLKNKDIILRRIEKLSRQKDKIEVKYKERQHTYLIEPFLEENVLKKLSDLHQTIVCFSTNENIEFVLKHWENLIKHSCLSIFFVNPFSKTEKIWIIYPQTHNGISERSSLKPGLYSLASQVESTTKKEVETILLSS